ncbi:Protein tyrosine kinase family protein [Aspergillus niger]|uniref:Protein tyrosine kinase family protein n=1 Tax=Aspergillus niger TaxID=5061 RepID=A0A505HZK0_ASPNG|nr:Protein tyrosine kinase family protein [Aspergillus niger]
MSFKDGNAWALRRAREREQMRLSGDTEQGSLSSLKIVKTISPDLGKLDFDSDLALPMPNPRTARANSIVNDSLSSSPSIPASGSGSGSLWSRSIAKKRSFTEPGRLAAAAASAGEKKSDKKSTFKALKAKLSLKDLKKEFRKDVPPASTMPKITILRDSSSSDPFAGKGNNFEVERLYTPRPRVMEVGSESLSRESSVIRLDDCLKDFRKVSDSSVRTPMKDGIAGGVGGERMSELGTKFRHTLIHSNDAEEGPASNLLDAVLLSGSSPAARTGEYRNSRLPEVVNTPQRACSYAAEPASPKSAASTVRESEAARMYSPSVYETALSDRMSDLPRRDYGVTSVEDVISLTPTRDSDSSVKKGSDTRLSSLASPASTFHAGPDESPSDYVPVDKAQLMGSTGRGGFAPMPPDPEYQNTAALEEQLASHVEQLHFHVQHAASKLVKTFEDKNNWHMDQVLRHVDTMVDLAQAINKKAAAQTELLREAQTAVADVRAHIDTLRREVRVIKSKIITAIHEEFGKLRYDLQEEGKLGPGNPASEGILTPSAGLQGPSFPVASLVNSTSSAYLSARDHQHQVTEKRIAWKDDYADSSGSPTPKASTFLDLPDLLVPAIEQAEALLTPAAQPKMEKPASKRSFFNLRRHRDSDNNASRTQENKHQAGDNNKAQENKNKPQVVDNTKLTTPTSNQESSVDPSTIHPLHRTPEQRRNLIERDLERIRLEKQQLAMLTTPSPTPARRPGVLKLSKSHTSISASNTLTTPSYDNGVSSSPPTLHGWPLPDVYKNRLPILPSRSSNSASTPAGFDNPYPIFRHPVPASSLEGGVWKTSKWNVGEGGGVMKIR